MAYAVIWSPRAVADVEALANYLATNSPAYTAAVVKKILRVTRNLALFPYAGRVVPEFADTLWREQFAYSYRIIYRVQSEQVLIAAVIHGKRLLEQGEV